MQRGYVGEEMALTAPEGKPLANAHDYVFAGWTDAPVADAVSRSSIIVLAVPFTAVRERLDMAGDYE